MLKSFGTTDSTSNDILRMVREEHRRTVSFHTSGICSTPNRAPLNKDTFRILKIMNF